jgi:glutamate-1-semialdehyde aminotransferase/spore coat polysaccharide biosynthesis protein SpsF (cytidylyltransferase family)/aryl-alcohol dehydrogenase-like predicted oxidoreductase
MELGLGTVQFGLDYGIGNDRGKTPFPEVQQILQAAAAAGVSWLDTGSMYGEAESVLGRALRNWTSDFKVVTKTPHFSGALLTKDDAEELESSLMSSLRKLGRSHVEALLIHSPADLAKPGAECLWRRMRALKERGLIHKMGASVYEPAQLRDLPRKARLDMVQIPLNFLDQNFLRAGELQRLRDEGTRVHVRSIYLQGLLLLEPDELPAQFDSIRGRLRTMQDAIHEAGLTVLEAPLVWAEHLGQIDVLFVGVTGPEEWQAVLAGAATRQEKARAWTLATADWHCSERDITNPSLWALENRTMSDVVAVLQARMSSSRFPGKVMAPILDRPMIAWEVERIRRCRRIDRLVLATSTHPSDDVLAEYGESLDLDVVRGSLDDVLDRFATVARHYPARHYVRLTADCPLIDPQVIDRTIEAHLSSGADYTSNCEVPTFPDGLDVEVMTAAALRRAAQEASTSSEREHVTLHFRQLPQGIRSEVLKNDRDLSEYRLTVDTHEDLVLVREIYKALGASSAFGLAEIMALLESEPTLTQQTHGNQRHDGLRKSLRKDELMRRYHASMEWLARAERSIPLGSQTFSKSRTQYPYGVSPYFIKRAKGAYVWDLDGNRYLDFVNSLAAVNLGYGDPDVTRAVAEQLQDGVIFSLPHPLETLVAEKLIEMIPCAERVRFGKNGSDATSGAVRVARAFTGRDHVICCGYHGWQDWYIGGTARNKGVPQATRDLVHVVAYNDLAGLERLLLEYRDRAAAVIMEPMTAAFPAAGYLEGVKELTHKHGALLIFDETITGFRFARGGAQELFGVEPDLATFGKGMANGFPISAVVGHADIMREMEEVFFSFTFGGETLSLAAALATMEKIQREPVAEQLRAQGEKIQRGLQQRIEQNDCQSFLQVGGHPAWSFLLFQDRPPYSSWQIKTLYLQEMFARGILTLGTHNVSYAHSEQEVAALLAAYDEVLPVLSDAVRGRLELALLCKPLEPLFKLR